MKLENKLVEEFPNIQTYFHERVTEAFQHQQIEADEHISFYLVNLLSHFMTMSKIQTREDGEEIPLAVLFCQAQQEEFERKASLLKYLGDFSLLVAGFFQESLNRKLVDLDYYVAMGEGAYTQLSSLASFRNQQELFRQLFSELASRFVQWVDIISEVSEVSHINSHQDILRLYERWIRTRSERLKDLLAQQGVIPLEGLKAVFFQ